MEPGQSTEAHTHELDEVVVCLEGGTIKVTKNTGQEEIHSVPSGHVFMPPAKGETHSLTNVGPSRYRQISIELK